MAGISVAYHIYKEMGNPPSIVMLEARELCSGATARNGGHAKIKASALTGYVSKFGDKTVNELQTYARGVISGLKEIVEEEELDCEFELRRSYEVTLDAKESTSLREGFEKSRKEGYAWTKEISWAPERHVEQVTSVKGGKSGCSVPACSFWPYKFNTQLVERLVSRYPKKFNVQTMTMVTAVSVAPDGVSLIDTSRGQLRAKKLVFATNAYTAGLLPQFQDVIVPYRGMASHISPKVPVHPHLSSTYNISFGSAKDADYLNPRPDGGIIVGGGKSQYASDKQSWFNNYDDSVRFNSEVEQYWDGYMQRTFHGWEESRAETDKIWVGIQAATPDGFPHVGKVPGRDGQWILAGFNGGGMGLIFTAAKAVAKMAVQGKSFDDVRSEFGIPWIFATSKERLRNAFHEDK